MAIEVNLKIRRTDQGKESLAVEEQFLRRDWDKLEERTLDLTSGVRTTISTLSDYSFLYVKVIGDDANVLVYKNLSPEAWTFDDTFMIWGMENVTQVSLKSDADTTVRLFIGGS